MRKYGLLVKAALRLHMAYSSGFQPVGYRSILWWATDRRVARIWKRGGYFERVRKVQTSLTRIFIVLESVSHGLSENWDEISQKARKFKGFFRPKTGGLQKKVSKKNQFHTVCPKIETKFLRKLGNSKVFSAQKQVVSKKKKKKVFTEIETDFSAEIRILFWKFWDWVFG